MASFVVKRAVKHVAEGIGCSERKAEKLGNIAKWGTAIATGDVIGVLADRVHRKYKDAKDYEQRCPAILPEHGCHYESDQDEDVEGEVIDNEGHHTLTPIHNFLFLAMAAYKDTSMADQFPFVKSSQLIRDVKKPARINLIFTTDTEAHVCLLQDGTLVFAFRGTEPIDWKCPLGDIVTDLHRSLVHLVHYNGSHEAAYQAPSSVRVHKGFQLAFQDVTKSSRPTENLRLVAEGLGVKAGDVKRVVCTGHSLGGALATLCAHWCRNVAYKDAEIWCVTIGSPRVGNQAFARDFNANVTHRKNSYRLVNKADVVPSIPHLGTHSVIMKLYKHVGGLIYLSDHPTSKHTIILKRGGFRSRSIRLTFQDHSMEAYLDSVNKVLASLMYLTTSPKVGQKKIH